MDKNYFRNKIWQGESKEVGNLKIVSAVQEYIGSLPLLVPIITRLRIREIVDRICPMERRIEGGLTHGEVFEALVCNRLTCPTPLYKVGVWASMYALDVMMGINPDKLNDDRIARTLDAISEKYDEIQSAIVVNMMKEFDIGANLVHYDLTSLSFEGEYEDSGMVMYGYNRDKRPDLKQVNLSLDVSCDGAIPLWSKVLKGNESDVTTVVENMENLKKQVKISDYAIVMDRGMISADNLFSMLEDGPGFIASTPIRSKAQLELIKSVAEDEFEKVDYTNTAGTDVIRAARREMELKTTKAESFTVVAWIFDSSEKRKSDISNRKKRVSKIVDILKGIKSKLNTRKYKERDYVLGQIEKQLGRKTARKFFRWELDGEDGELELEFWLDEEEMQKAEILDGRYILITDSPDRSADVVISSYKSQNKIEKRFSHLKNHLNVTPLFLKKDNRIEGLVFTTIMGLTVYSLLEYLCKNAQIHQTAFMLLARDFGDCAFVKIRFSNGETAHVGCELTPFQKTIIDALNFPHPGEYL